MFNIYLVWLMMGAGALLFALVFSQINIPLPWILGPMVSTVILKLKFPAQVFLNIRIRNLFLIPLGYNIGVFITAEAYNEVMRQFWGLLISTCASILVSVILAWWTRRETGISQASSTIGNMPGGLTPMLLLCESVPAADIGVVAVLQSMRLMITVATVPLLLAHGFGASAAPVPVVNVALPIILDVPVLQLVAIASAGAIVAHYLKVPADFFLGPIITTGVFSLYMGVHLQEIPHWLMALAQISTGIYLGTFIDPFQLSENKRLFPVCIIGAFLLISASLLIGYFLSMFLGFSVTTAFLACAPGGVAEMSLTGMILGENVPIILAYQLFRMLVLNLIVPASLKWYFTR
jgi:membrane AbrB-like protein